MHGDVPIFDRFARAYDLVMPAADADALAAGLAEARRDVNLVLDVAGGSGRGARAIPGIERVVVDAARGMCEQARRHGVAAVQGDAARLPVREERVDAVTVVDAMHHLPDRDGAIESAAGALAPGGVLAVAAGVAALALSAPGPVESPGSGSDA